MRKRFDPIYMVITVLKSLVPEVSMAKTNWVGLNSIHKFFVMWIHMWMISVVISLGNCDWKWQITSQLDQIYIQCRVWYFQIMLYAAVQTIPLTMCL